MCHYYPRSGHHCRFKNPLHCRVLNRQCRSGSDASWLSVPALHPAVISFKKTKQKNIQQACSRATAATAISSSNSSSKKQFTHHIQRRRDSTHHKSTHPQIDSYNIEGGEGRPGGGESEIPPGRVSLVSRRRPTPRRSNARSEAAPPLIAPMIDLR